MHLTFVIVCWAQQHIPCRVLLVINNSVLACSTHGPTGLVELFLHEHQTNKCAQMDHTSLLVLGFLAQHRRKPNEALIVA